MQITRRLRFKILDRDNFTCQYCGRKAPDVKIEVDHVLPLCKGGGHSPKNLKACCYDCNIGKSGTFISLVKKTPQYKKHLKKQKKSEEDTLRIIRKMEAERLLKTNKTKK